MMEIMMQETILVMTMGKKKSIHNSAILHFQQIRRKQHLKQKSHIHFQMEIIVLSDQHQHQ